MKLQIEIDLGFVEVITNSGDGRVDEVWVNGGNFADRTVEEFIISCAGGPTKWARLISEKTEATRNKIELDREEDDYGVPI